MNPLLRADAEAALRRRRALLLDEVAEAEADLTTLGETRESELEERAQLERLQRVVARLDERARHEIEEIHAALQRILDGTWGRCERCGELIEEARLRAVPEARRCLACAATAEAGEETAAEGSPAGGHPTVLGPDVASLSDRERQAMVRELIERDGRVDMHELRVVSHHGVIHLEGSVPSEAERDIAVKLVTDVGGFADVVDRLRVDETAWERAERPGPAHRPSPPRFEPLGTEDVVESEELGVAFVPPAGPPADEE